MGHHEHHGREHCDIPAEERIMRLGRATVTNAFLAVFSAGVSIASGNTGFISEAIHDLGDTVAHGTRYSCEVRGVNQKSRAFQMFRRASFGALGVLSGVIAIRNGLAIPESLGRGEDFTTRVIELAGSGVVAGGNWYAFSQVDEIEEHTDASHDSHHHARTDRNASLGLAVCVAADVAGANGMSEVGGALFGAYTAWELTRAAIDPNHHG